MNKLIKILIVTVLGFISIIGLYKTNHIQRIHGFTDMRNRVVGARLMKDGMLPYYYHWRPGQPLRYAVERLADTGSYRRVSMMTASPFFHRLLTPVADFDESTLEKALFIFCYVLLLCIILITWTQSNLLLILLFFVPFLFTDSWWHHIIQSQYYLIFGFLLFIVSVCLYKKYYIAAGIVFAFLILLRLNCIIFIIPFLLYYKKYRTFLLSSFAAVALYVSVVMFLPFEKANWIEYFSAIKEHAMVHSGQLVYPGGNYSMNNVFPRVFEGFNLTEMDSIRVTEGFQVNPAATNFKSVYTGIFKGKVIPSKLFQFMFLAIIAILSYLLFAKNKKIRNEDFKLKSLVYMGFLLYFLSDFFSPIDNAPYQMSQWIALTGLLLMDYKHIPKIALLCMFMGIVINIFYIPLFPFKHMWSEFLFITATMLAIYRQEKPVIIT